MENTKGLPVKCNTCGATIQSMHRHDFKWCDCPETSDTKIAVDGGADYLRMLFGSKANYEVLRGE